MLAPESKIYLFQNPNTLLFVNFYSHFFLNPNAPPFLRCVLEKKKKPKIKDGCCPFNPSENIQNSIIKYFCLFVMIMNFFFLKLDFRHHYARNKSTFSSTWPKTGTKATIHFNGCQNENAFCCLNYFV